METHVSVLTFVGDLVHKRKKPVRFPFIDLTTAEQREALCRREVELNRRFSPDVYLGVEEIVDESGHVVDHAVLMRRLPAERRLAALAGQGADVASCVRAVARAVARCHADAPRSERISSIATPNALRALWRASLDEIAEFTPTRLDGEVVDSVEMLASRYLEGRTALLSERIARGRIVDGHGDLLTADIFCLDDGPRILDCLEFDDHLRWGDVLADIGFLAMDLERLGRYDLSTALLDWYREFSAETHPRSLEHHYLAYRALVRCKISCLRGGDDDFDAARAYLTLCHRHLLDGRVHLVVVGGLPGTGKTTLALNIGRRQGWTVLRSDELRKQNAGLDPLEHRRGAFGTGLYAATTTDDTYSCLLERAAHLLRRGESVVLDASFAADRWRRAAADVAASTTADLAEVCCRLPASVASERIATRCARGRDDSDATESIAAAMATTFDPWPTATVLDTLPPTHDVVAAVLDEIGVDHARTGAARSGARRTS